MEMLDKYKRIIAISNTCVLTIFVVELVLGFTGTMIMVAGNPIRKLLFLLTGATLYLSSTLYIVRDRKSVDRIITAMGYHEKINVITDISVTLLIIYYLLETFIIPRIYNGNLSYAKAEALDSIGVLLLYYPLRYLNGHNLIIKPFLNKTIKIAVLALSVFHIINYIGQIVSQSFMTDIFVAFDSIIPGESVFPPIIQGHLGYPRVMFGTSVYLLFGIYYSIKSFNNSKWYDYICSMINIIGVLTTMTKSIWFGLLLGLSFVIMALLCFCIKSKTYSVLRTVFVYVLIGIITIVSTNQLLFNDMIKIRAQNSFVIDESQKIDNIDQSVNQAKEDNYNVDFNGAVYSNNIKIEQTLKMFEKWKSSPLIGHGFGAYIEDYLRSVERPFSYEMQAPAMLMKTGVVGIGLFGVFIISMMLAVQKNRIALLEKCSWYYLLIAFGISVQTNPLLFSYTGMSVILFLLFISRTKEVNSDNENKDNKKLYL